MSVTVFQAHRRGVRAGQNLPEDRALDLPLDACPDWRAQNLADGLRRQGQVSRPVRCPVLAENVPRDSCLPDENSPDVEGPIQACNRG